MIAKSYRIVFPKASGSFFKTLSGAINSHLFLSGCLMPNNVIFGGINL